MECDMVGGKEPRATQTKGWSTERDGALPPQTPKKNAQSRRAAPIRHQNRVVG